MLDFSQWMAMPNNFIFLGLHFCISKCAYLFRVPSDSEMLIMVCA